ncbi:MAG: 4-hydroxy-tetrahydrodipicolinate synthase [Chloroflexota bacterium]|nr:4-hydroxy-tetrahydrodipicolinate synthase [Chloroflexota bacterium]
MTRTGASRPGGIVCPLVTPLTADGRLEEDVLRGLIDALVPTLDGLFVLGSSGELTWLPDDVALHVARVAVEQVSGRVPVYVGIGDTGLGRTLARADRVADVGADYLVVAAPFYYPVTSEAGVVEYFETIAARASAPVVLYNIPQNTHLTLTTSTVRTLAGHPNIVGIKDSAGDWLAFDAFLAMRADDFSVMQGREHLAAISLWSGADGLISALANFAPRLLQALAAAVRDERPRSEILALQAAVGELATVFDQGDWLSGLKVTLQTLGWNVGEPSLPIRRYDAAQRLVVEGILSAPEIAPWLSPRPAHARPALRAVE